MWHTGSVSTLRWRTSLLLLGLGALVLVLLLLSAPRASGGGSGAWPPSPGQDWLVDEDTRADNTTVRWTSSIVVRNNSLLHLENVTFTFASQQVDQIGITVQGGSRLELVDVTLRSERDTGYYFVVAGNVTGYWDRVDVSGVRSNLPGQDGPLINGFNYTLANSTLHDSTYGVLTSSFLTLQNNTFYNTSVAIVSLGDLDVSQVVNNTFEYQGYNNSVARFQHLALVDLSVVDQYGVGVGGAWVEATDDFDLLRLARATWSDGRLLDARLPNMELTLDGQERFPRRYNLTASFLSAYTNASLDLGTQATLEILLPLKPDLVAGPLYAPLPDPLISLIPGRDNATSFLWTEQAPSDDSWQQLDFNASEWDPGTLPLGGGSVEGVAPATAWEGGVAYLRFTFYLPADSIIHQATLRWAAAATGSGDRVNVYLNGPRGLAGWQGPAEYWSNSVVLPGDQLRPGKNVVTVRYQTSQTPFFDLQLEVTIARPPTTPLIAGAPQQLLAVVANPGSREATLARLELHVDGNLTTSLRRTLPATATLALTFTLPSLSPGNHTLALLLDPEGDLDEDNTTNNLIQIEVMALTVAFEVLTAPEALTLHTYEQGQTVVEVANRGEVADTPRLFLDPAWEAWNLQLVGTAPRLAPNATANLTFLIDPPPEAAEGDHQLQLEVGSSLGPLAEGSRDPFNLNATILRSYDLAWDPATPTTYFFPLETPTPVSLQLLNLGNGPDQVNLSLVAPGDLAAKGWNVTLLQKVANLGTGATYQVDLRVLREAAGTRQPGQVEVVALSSSNDSRQARLTLELLAAGFTSVEPLPAYQRTATFSIPWTLVDNQGLFENVYLYHRARPLGGAWEEWLQEPLPLVPGFAPTFTGRDGYTYQFYTRARLGDGSWEQKLVGEAETTVDLVRPKSWLQILTPLDSRQQATVQTLLNITWGPRLPQGLDVVSYDLELKQDHLPWQLLLANTTQTAAQFELEPGHTYLVRTRAWDAAGWQELEDSGSNRVGLTVLNRPYWAQLETNISATRSDQITGWIVLEPTTEVHWVQLQYRNPQGNWVTFARFNLSQANNTPAAQNTSVTFNLPREGDNYLRAVVEDLLGQPVAPGPWSLTLLGNGLTGQDLKLERQPFWDTVVVTADPEGEGTYGLNLTLGNSNLSYALSTSPPRVLFGDGFSGYRPSYNEFVKATYEAYDVLVNRNSLPPEAPVWLEFKLDPKTGQLRMKLGPREFDDEVTYWLERADSPEGPWFNLTSKISTIPASGHLVFIETLQPGMVYYYRVAIRDNYDRTNYTTLQIANLTLEAPIIENPPDTASVLSISQVLLMVVLGLAIVGGVVGKFFWDHRREGRYAEVPPPPFASSGQGDPANEGFKVVAGSVGSMLTVECRACGHRRSVSPSQAKEEVTCAGCGTVMGLDLAETDREETPPTDKTEEPEADKQPEEDPESFARPSEADSEAEVEEAQAAGEEAGQEESLPELEPVPEEEGGAPAQAEAAEAAPEAEGEVAEAEVVEPLPGEPPTEVAVVVAEVAVAEGGEAAPEALPAEAEPLTGAAADLPAPGMAGEGQAEPEETPSPDREPRLCPACGTSLPPLSPEELPHCPACGWTE